eukprot:s3478_g5.t1
MKRPSAAPSTLGLAEEEDEEKLKPHIPEGVVEAAMDHARSLDTEDHTRQGMSKEDAQAVGRVAGRMAGAQFDKEWPNSKTKGQAASKAKPKKKPCPKKKTCKKKKKTPKEPDQEEVGSHKNEEGSIPEEMEVNQDEDEKGVDID